MSSFLFSFTGSALIFVISVLWIIPHTESVQLAGMVLMVSMYTLGVYIESISYLERLGQSRQVKLHQLMLGAVLVVVFADICAVWTVANNFYLTVVVITGTFVAAVTLFFCVLNLRRDIFAIKLFHIHPATVKGIAMIVVVAMSVIATAILTFIH